MTNKLLARNDQSCVKPCGALGIIVHARSISRSQTLKKLKNSQLKNLDDAYIILMPMFDIVKWNLTQLMTRSLSGQQHLLLGVVLVFWPSASVWCVMQRFDIVCECTELWPGGSLVSGVLCKRWPMSWMCISVCLALVYPIAFAAVIWPWESQG